jgi:hypothetical protein
MADAILIPGGGIRGGGKVPLWVQRRLDRAIERWKGEYIIALSAGTTHKPPPLDETGFPVFESVASARYLVERGIDARKVLVETCSYDTIGNAYFSKVIHVDPMGFRKLLVITSSFHIDRTRAIFEWVYGLDALPGGSYSLDFEEVPDEGMDEELLSARIGREKESLRHVLKLKEAIRTFREFHRWLFTEHGAYSVSVKPELAKGKSLDTY